MKFHILTGDTLAALTRVEVKLDLLLRLFVRQEKIMEAELEALKTSVDRTTTVEQSAITLITGLAAQIASLKTDPAALQALSESLTAQADALAAAVTANTVSPA